MKKLFLHGRMHVKIHEKLLIKKYGTQNCINLQECGSIINILKKIGNLEKFGKCISKELWIYYIPQKLNCSESQLKLFNSFKWSSLKTGYL